jgi:hypothetical protein
MSVPEGYVTLRRGIANAVVRADALLEVDRALASGTLHDFARDIADRELRGRAAAYVCRLRDDLRVVVRHNTHGGAFARLTGDRFLAPTRAPMELAASLRLIAAGVPTPPIVAIVRYRAGGPLERSDVATEEIIDAADLAHVMTQQPERHAAAARATADLLRALAHAGARHADLNIKNVLLQPAATGLRAFVLDVDRVTFHELDSADVRDRNWARLLRSARKWRTLHGAPISDEWLESVRQASHGN